MDALINEVGFSEEKNVEKCKKRLTVQKKAKRIYNIQQKSSTLG
jgi:hypothetical protein